MWLGCGGDDGAATAPSPDTADARAGSDAAVNDGGEPIDAASVDGADPGPPDPCAAEKPVCPVAPAGFAEGAGLAPIDRCAFPLTATALFDSRPPLVTALEGIATKATMADVLADLNRDATETAVVPGSPPGVAQAFRWNAEDQAGNDWIPQGISGSPDANATAMVDGKRVVIVSWYHTPPEGGLDKGTRLAVVDVTNPATPKYRLVLLVAPSGTPAAPSFVPINLHAGGVVWVGDLLYVADTSRGFRVFDFRHLLRVETDVDEIGCAAGKCRGGLYKYVLPEIGAYADASSCDLIFSWVSLDRSSSPPALVSGEYCSTTACAGPLAGRIVRWPLDANGHIATRGATSTSWPEATWLMGQKQVQGGAMSGATAYLSSSAPAGGAGALYRVAVGKSATSKWIDTPEDLMIDPTKDQIWSLSEGEGARVVFGASRASYPAP